MRILFLTCHLPFPPISGGRRREYELLTRLSRTHEIHLYCVCKTFEDDQRNAGHLRAYCAEVVLFRAAGSPTQNGSATHPRNSHHPPQVIRHMSREATASVWQALQTRAFDIVHVEGYYLMQHLPSACSIPILLGEQNIEYLLCQQRLTVAATERDRKRLWGEYVRTLEWERVAWRRAALCVAVTKDDQGHMQEQEPSLDVRLVPDGLDHDTRVDGAISGEDYLNRGYDWGGPTVLYVGNFAYEPNVDAALHLARDIFPAICRAVPTVRLLLVGNAPPPAIQALAATPQIVVTGLVPSLEPFFATADVVICPLRVGGGVKVKVLEALNRGKAVVSTSVGIQGLDMSSGQAIVVKDDPTEFAQAVVRLLFNPGERRRLEEAARRFARGLPTWDGAASALSACYEELSVSSRPLTRP